MVEGARAPQRQQPVLVIMGVSGSGKSTVASLLAGQLGWDLAEGDDLHPTTNVAKMSAGIPLTDEDRWPWLDRVATWIRDHTAAGAPGIITCSALKRSYRDKLAGDNVVFVHLAVSADNIGQRLSARLDHYMPATLLDSQIADLDPPGPDENALSVTAGRSPTQEAAEIIRRLHLTPQTGTIAPHDAPGHPGQEHAAVAMTGKAEIGLGGEKGALTGPSIVARGDAAADEVDAPLS
jgi:gluconokinase